MTLQERYDNILREDTHSTHIEDEVLKGPEGIKRMLNFFKQSISLLEGNQEGPTPSVKFDGAPAVLCATDFDGVEGPFISTKSLFNASPKFYQSDADIDADNRPEGLKTKLRYTLRMVQSPGFKIPHNEIWQGDLLWTKGDTKSYSDKGEEYVYVQPNTLVYSAPRDSDIGQAMVNKEIGVVFHTRYRSPNGDISNLSTVRQSNDVRVSELQGIPDSAFIIDALLQNGQGKVSWTKQESDVIWEMYNSLSDIVDGLSANKSYKQLCNNEEFVQFYVMTLQNSKVDQQTDINPEQFVSDLHYWVTNKMRRNYTGLGKLKTKTGRDNKRLTIGDTSKELHNIIEKHSDVIEEIAEVLSLATELKAEIMTKMEEASQFITMVEKRDGSFNRTGGEGFVVSDTDGKFVKLVDRKSFSYFNRSDDVVKGFEHQLHEALLQEDEEGVEGEDYITLEFDSQAEADEAVKDINAESKALDLLEESRLYEKDDIAQKQVGDWQFKTKRDAVEFLEELESKYSAKSYEAELSGASPKFYVKVNKISKDNGKVEVKAQTIKASEVKASKSSPASSGAIDGPGTVYPDKRAPLIDLFTLVYSYMPPAMQKSIGFSESSKGNTATSSITMNVFKVDDIDETGKANPASDAEIKDLASKLKTDKLIDGSSESIFGLKFRIKLIDKERDYKIYFRETGGKGPCRPYYFRNGKVLIAPPSTFSTYTDTQKTQLSESITAYFLAETVNGAQNISQKIDKAFESFASFTAFLGQIEFDKEANFEASSNIEEALEIGFSSFKSSWLNSIKIISNSATLSEIKNCFADTSFSGKYVPCHPSIKIHNSDLLFSRLRNVPGGGAVDSINPADIYLVKQDAIQEVLSFKSTSLAEFIARHNELLHNKRIIALSLKQLAKNSTFATVSTSHNSTSKKMNLKKGVFLHTDTFKDFVLEKPGILDETSKKEGLSCIIHCVGQGNNIKEHLHLDVRNNEIILDIRKTTNQKDLLGTPSIEAGASGLAARLGKGSAAVPKLIPFFNKQFKDELLSILNLKKFEMILNKVGRLRESQNDLKKLADMFESEDMSYLDFKKAHKTELQKTFGSLNYVDTLFKEYNSIKQSEINNIRKLIDSEPSLKNKFEHLAAVRNFVYGYTIAKNFKPNKQAQYTKLLAMTMKYKVLGIDPNDTVNQTVDYIKIY
jgi:hypothetical protein